MAKSKRTLAYLSLAHDARLKIAMMAKGRKAYNRHRAIYPGEIAEAIGISDATLSFHLAKMVDGGVLDSECEGRHVYFWLTGLGRELLGVTGNFNKGDE